MNLSKFIAKFGLFNGLVLYFKFRYGKTTELRLPNVEHAFYIKPNSIDNASFKEIFLNGEYEINYPEFKSQIVNIIDAGANIGLASVFFANRFSNSNVLAIEPERENFKSLLKNTCKYENIKPICGAVWKSDCQIEIVDNGWGTRGFMIKETKAKNDNSFNGLSINNLMSSYNFKIIDILKIDVEGSEKEIFEANYEEWLPKTKCIIIELHDRMKEGCSKSVHNAISKYNFTSFKNGENVVFINDSL